MSTNAPVAARQAATDGPWSLQDQAFSRAGGARLVRGNHVRLLGRRGRWLIDRSEQARPAFRTP
jgi:hypothetical protein